MSNYKQVILVRRDLKMSAGKISAQVAHASTEAAFKSDEEKIKTWRKEGMKKIVLRVESEEDLLNMEKLANKFKLVNTLIRDAGKTQLDPGTITCLGIGPDKEENINKVSGKLKVL